MLAGSDPKREAEPSPRPEGTSLVLDLMRRANGRGDGGRRAARTLWPDVDEDALLLAHSWPAMNSWASSAASRMTEQFGPDDAELLAPWPIRRRLD